MTRGGNVIRHFSLFSGIESFKKALTNLGIENELVGYSEIDKYASVALTAIHGVSENLNFGDITKIDETKVPDCDLISYGFPCQDISIAGLGKGIIEGETRSGLLYDALRIIKHKKPKYAIAENVKNLVGKRFKGDFDALLEELDSYGYNNYWQVLNSKDYGIPQNRERVFVVSIRKDIDKGYEFPKPYDSGLRLKDLLEDEVEDKYYIDNERTGILLKNLKDKEMLPGGINVSKQGKVFDGSTEVVSCLLARDYKGLGNQSMTAVAEPKICQKVGDRGTNNYSVKDISNTIPANPMSDRGQLLLEPILIGGMQKNQSIKRDGISTTLVSAMGTGGGYVPMIAASRGRNPNNPSDRTAGSPTEQRLEPNTQGITNTLTTVQKDNLVLEPSNELKLFTNLKGGKWDKIHESARRVYDEEGIAPTIPTCGGGNIEPKVQTNYKIRKLTPKECWRLMGFTGEDYFKARAALEDKFYNGKDRSNSQMYKMAGNSIVVDVLEKILENLLKEEM